MVCAAPKGSVFQPFRVSWKKYLSVSLRVSYNEICSLFKGLPLHSIQRQGHLFLLKEEKNEQMFYICQKYLIYLFWLLVGLHLECLPQISRQPYQFWITLLVFDITVTNQLYTRNLIRYIWYFQFAICYQLRIDTTVRLEPTPLNCKAHV